MIFKSRERNLICLRLDLGISISADSLSRIHLVSVSQSGLLIAIPKGKNMHSSFALTSEKYEKIPCNPGPIRQAAGWHFLILPKTNPEAPPGCKSTLDSDII
jgi:hypothetical protein